MAARDKEKLKPFHRILVSMIMLVLQKKGELRRHRDPKVFQTLRNILVFEQEMTLEQLPTLGAQPNA